MAKNKRGLEQTVKKAAKNPKFFVAWFLLLLVFVATASLILWFCGDAIINKLYPQTPSQYGEIDFSNGLKIDVIDVGQGDAIFINLPDGKTMLIDSGDSGSSRTKFTAYIEEYYSSKPKVLDYCILTHPDSDHGYNMAYVFEYLQVNTAYRPNVYFESENTEIPEGAKVLKETEKQFYKKYVECLYSEPNCQVIVSAAGLEIEGTGYTFTFYSPNKNYYSDYNNYSPIIVLEYLGKRVCLTGDAETANEAEVVGSIPKCDVLKAGHHGSDTSSTEKFLNKVLPTYVLVSCGAGNKYGHPKPEFLERVNACPSVEHVFRTDEVGTITMYINSELVSKNLIYFNSLSEEDLNNNKLTKETLIIVADGVIVCTFIAVLVVHNAAYDTKKQRKRK